MVEVIQTLFQLAKFHSQILFKTLQMIRKCMWSYEEQIATPFDAQVHRTMHIACIYVFRLSNTQDNEKKHNLSDEHFTTLF